MVTLNCDFDGWNLKTHINFSVSPVIDKNKPVGYVAKKGEQIYDHKNKIDITIYEEKIFEFLSNMHEFLKESKEKGVADENRSSKMLETRNKNTISIISKGNIFALLISKDDRRTTYQFAVPNTGEQLELNQFINFINESCSKENLFKIRLAEYQNWAMEQRIKEVLKPSTDQQKPAYNNNSKPNNNYNNNRQNTPAKAPAPTAPVSNDDVFADDFSFDNDGIQATSNQISKDVNNFASFDDL
jgi:hypothetical protein